MSAHMQLSPDVEIAERERDCRARLDREPSHVDSLQQLGELLQAQGRDREAVDCFRRALEQLPTEPRLYKRFASALLACGDAAGAVEVYQMALALGADAAAHNNLAVALKQLGKLEQAQSHLQRALQLEPAYADALLNMGNLLTLAGDPTAAIDYYRRALERDPSRAATYTNVGNACQTLGRFAEAAELYEVALGLESELSEARWNRALLWLQQGDYVRGWPEYRWGTATGDRPRRELQCPRWVGQDVNGKRIVIYAEQGLGDTLQFVRFLPRLRRDGAYVILECQKSLRQLVRDSGLAEEIVAAGDPLPEADFFASLLDLPALFETTLETLPAPSRYLRPDAARSLRWQKYIGGFSELRVGLCWAGGSAYRANQRRSCALTHMAPLATVQGVCYFNLQRGEAAKQALQPPPGLRLEALDTEWDEFSDMAAAIANLDLVITVDTSVAHLAGALGVPTWVLLPDVADWRWLLHRDDSPWYPAVKLFRQVRAGDWTEVLNRVSEALARLLAERSSCDVVAVEGIEDGDAHAAFSDQADSLNQAMRLHDAGDLDAAARIYEQVLAHDRDNPDALRLLGTIFQARGELEQAAEYVERALKVVPDSALIYTTLGDVYQKQHAPGLALQCFHAALQIDPAFVDAWFGIGVAHQLQAQQDSAIGAYRQVLALRPGHQRAYFNLALALQAAGQRTGSEAMLRGLLELAPDHVDGNVQLGQLLLETDQLDQAAVYFERARAADDTCFDAHHLLGNVRKDQGHFDQAVACYRRALELRPDAMGVHNNLGNTFRAAGRPDDAEGCYLRAVQLCPDAPEAYNNLGTLYKDRGQLSKAQEWFEKTLVVAPDFNFALGNLAKVYQESCAWDRYEPVLQRLVAATDELLTAGKRVPMQPFFALSLPVSAEHQQRVARNYARTVVSRGLIDVQLPPGPKPDASGRLRIGYVSSDFHNHATAQLMLSLFGLHDRAGFEIYAYSLGQDDGSVYRQRIAADCDHFVDVYDWHYTDIARRIAADGIHILVDLKGYTMDIKPEIFALRPAPIQVNYLGFPGTMGASFMDYIVTDRVVTPPDQQQYFDEAFAYLPHSYQVNDHRQAIAEQLPTRLACGLPEQGFVYCCFNNNYKIEPEGFGSWMRILAQVPGSVLWLLRASPESEANLRRAAQERGVEPHRLVFAERQPKAEHLARHRLADLFLDTFYYNAHTTASDALWAGLPVLTCLGSTFASRVAASLLRAVGLEELVVHDRDAYERRAVELATDRQALNALRARLQEEPERKPLFDTERFARNLESAYREMWRRHSGGEKPSMITVEESETATTRSSLPAPPQATYNELLIGCGREHSKTIHVNERPHWTNLVTLDINRDHCPDVVWDLNRLPLPFEDNTFDEIHAYEVLEHIGTQGDYRFFFAQFSDFWRILKPGGVLVGTVPLPTSPWAWGDPSHTRVIPKENFLFLEQPQYTAQVGRTPISDFRYLYQADFERIHISEQGDKLSFVLQAIKPARIRI